MLLGGEGVFFCFCAVAGGPCLCVLVGWVRDGGMEGGTVLGFAGEVATGVGFFPCEGSVA